MTQLQITNLLSGSFMLFISARYAEQKIEGREEYVRNHGHSRLQNWRPVTREDARSM